MATIIEFYSKSNYGNDLKYIVDPKIAKAVTRLTGMKTITAHVIQGLEELGFTFKEVLAPKII